jgi:hypothetical protein|tara:strand:- start:47 stop:361 length:315 start_codon:yes stop_codon:yes gene_type:complete
MANLTEYLTAKYTKMITEMSADLGAQVDKVADLQNMIRALKTPDMLLNGGPLTLDRIQIMEDGNFRILPMPPVPAETCIAEVSKDFGKNGKKDNKEPVLVNDPA